jgi:hypothetical protein
MTTSVFVSKPNKALAVPRTKGMMGIFPDGKPLQDLWVIKHGMYEHALLTRLGMRVPHPMGCYYDWSGASPFSVQKITCQLLTSSPRAYVLNDMGTGKTRATLWAWDYLRANNYCGKLLVVAPLSTLNLVWAHEALVAVPHRPVAVLWGSKKKRLAQLNSDAEIFIVNHDGVKVLLDELKARKDIDCMVIDELAFYRNKNPRSTQMTAFAQPFKFVWGLTGSPMPNEPTDVWQQCRIITPHTVPRYRSHARDMLMNRKSDYVWVPKSDAVERAFSWMQPAVRFSLDDVVELPEVVTRYIDVPMTPQQNNVYTEVARDFVAMVGSGKIKADNAAGAMNKLLQISGGFVYTTHFDTIELDIAPRKQILLDLIRASSGKVLVFCPFRHMVLGLSKTLGINPDDPDTIEHALIHGDVPVGERNRIFDAFQRTSQYKVILAHPACMSHGLTLTSADTIIWYCPLPNLDIYEQANARIRRVGQRHRQQVFHLQATPVERRIYSLLRRKAKVQDMLLSLFEDQTLADHGEQPQEKTNGSEDHVSDENGVDNRRAALI